MVVLVGNLDLVLMLVIGLGNKDVGINKFVHYFTFTKRLRL